MTRTPLALMLTLLFAAGCDRNAPPDLVRGIGAPPPASAPPAVAEDSKAAETAKSTSSAPAATKKPPAAKASTAKVGTRKPATPAPGRARGGSGPAVEEQSMADDPCAGLDGRELDDCLGYEEGDEPEDSREFAAEQRRRDRELLARDAEEAARRARDLEEQAIVPEDDYDLPLEEDLPADDYDPRYDGDPQDEPPPEDDGDW